MKHRSGPTSLDTKSENQTLAPECGTIAAFEAQRDFGTVPALIPCRKVDFVARFWSHVEVLKNGQCWNWKGAVDGSGYGKFKVGRALVRSSRIAWAIAAGWQRIDGHIIHTCDNPRCVNPAHLRLADHRTNMADMAAKGRARNGTTSKASKVQLRTPSDPLKIRGYEALPPPQRGRA